MGEGLQLAAAVDRKADMVCHKRYLETLEERLLTEHMADLMRQMGLGVELQPVVGERVKAIGSWRGTGGGKSLLFNGHLNTNPVTEGWTVDPWGGGLDEDFICSIGVSNMEAGDASSLCAVSTRQSAANRGDRPAGLLGHGRRTSLGRGRDGGRHLRPGGRYNTMPDERVDIVDYLITMI